MAIHLSKERFESTEYGALISWGVIENSPDGVFMTSDSVFPLLWTAWKGQADDWAIYVMRFDTSVQSCPHYELELCHSRGDKVHGKDLISRMVDADPEVLARYRR